MIKCKFCNKISYPRLEIKNWQIFKCQNCKISFLNPEPQNIEKIYDYDYFKNWYLQVYEKRYKYNEKILKKIKKFIPEKCKILDIGCGVGIFMDLMKKKGNEVYGLDISDFALNFCKEKGFKVYNSLSEIDPAEKFDVITIMDVIAHIKNPVDYLQKCKKILHPNGILIIKTPLHSNYLFFIAKVLKFTGKSRAILHLPAQIYHFDKYSILNLTNLTGFKLKKIIIVKEFTEKKFSIINLWKFLIERSMIGIFKNE